MFRNLAEDITFLLIKNKIVEIEKREIYIYGLEIILLNGGLLITFLIISLLCGEMVNFLAYLIFFSMFISVRLYTVGYHVKTFTGCKTIFITICLNFRCRFIVFLCYKNTSHYNLDIWCECVQKKFIFSIKPTFYYRYLQKNLLKSKYIFYIIILRDKFL